MEEEKKNKGGRPSKKDTINIVQLKKLVLSGWTDKQIADFYDITEQTFNNWKKDSQFFESLKDWKVEADSKVERSLYERALGYSHPEEKIFQYEGDVVRAETIRHYPPDPTSMIFWLKNRQPERWRDNALVDQSSKTVINIIKNHEPGRQSDRDRLGVLPKADVSS